jgi:hypothetical protein
MTYSRYAAAKAAHRTQLAINQTGIATPREFRKKKRGDATRCTGRIDRARGAVCAADAQNRHARTAHGE